MSDARSAVPVPDRVAANDTNIDRASRQADDR